MFKRFFLDPAPIALDQGIATVRILVGALLTYHGIEVFDSSIMAEYMTWEVFAGSNAGMLVYIGKSFELVAGLLYHIGDDEVGNILQGHLDAFLAVYGFVVD